jgi:hypothetical protein
VIGNGLVETFFTNFSKVSKAKTTPFGYEKKALSALSRMGHSSQTRRAHSNRD